VVTFLPLDTRFAGSNPAEVSRFLRVIKIRSTTYFGGKVQTSVPCRKILRHVKEPYEYERYSSLAKFNGNFSPSFS
jgi:hypothetical protein